MQTGYELSVVGRYFSRAEKGKSLKNYGPEVFFLPSEMEIQTGYKWEETVTDGHKIRRAVPKKERVNSLAWANHILKKYFLPTRLAEKHPDFVALQTQQIISSKKAERESAAISDVRKMKISDMSVPQLKELCIFEGLMLIFDSFPTVEDARRAVAMELAAKQKAQKPASSVQFPEPEQLETESSYSQSVTTSSPEEDLLA